jgi:hypothetical protein
VVRTRTDEREAERDVHALFQAEIFDGNQTLVVILSHDDVEAAIPGLHEHGVARPWAACVNALGSRSFERRADDPDFFVAEKAPFPGMRVETCDSHARRLDSERPTALMRQPNGRQLRIEIRLLDSLAHRGVDRHQNRSNLAVGEHHRDALGTAMFGQDFGMAGIEDSRFCHRFLVDRGGDDAADRAGLRCRYRRDDRVESGLAGDGADEAERRRHCDSGGLDYLDDAFPKLRLARRSDRSDRHVEAQAGHDVLHDHAAAEDQSALAAFGKRLRHDLGTNA